jgi:hypothetical protein
MDNTIQLTTIGGHNVVFRSFITGRQKRHISDAFLEDLQFTQNGDTQNFSVAGAKANIAQDRAIEAVVISVDGIAEKVIDLVLDLPAADSDQVLAKVNEITGDKKKEKNIGTT